MSVRIEKGDKLMKRTVFALLAAVAMLLSAATQANAGSITYKVSDTATGIIGDTTFANALVTIAFFGNTSNVTTGPPGILFNSVGTGTVTINGIGTFSFTDALRVFDNQNFSVAGISDISVESDIFDTFNSAFGTYALATTIGPLSGSSVPNVNISFATTDGSLIFSEVGADSTFTATTPTTTPEPSSLLLFGTSLLGLLPFGRKLLGK